MITDLAKNVQKYYKEKSKKIAEKYFTSSYYFYCSDIRPKKGVSQADYCKAKLSFYLYNIASNIFGPTFFWVVTLIILSIIAMLTHWSAGVILMVLLVINEVKCACIREWKEYNGD